MATTANGIWYPDTDEAFPSRNWWQQLASSVDTALRARLVPYTEIALSSPWSNEGTNADAGYYQTSDGMVHLVGRIKTTTTPPGSSTIAATSTIPFALRPAQRTDFTVALWMGSNTTDVTTVYVDSSGKIVTLGYAPSAPVASLFLNGISWMPGI